MLGWALRKLCFAPMGWGVAVTAPRGVQRAFKHACQTAATCSGCFTSSRSQLCSEANCCTVKLNALCRRRCTEFKILFLFPLIELDRWRLLLIAMPHDPMESATPYTYRQKLSEMGICVASDTQPYFFSKPPGCWPNVIPLNSSVCNGLFEWGLKSIRNDSFIFSQQFRQYVFLKWSGLCLQLISWVMFFQPYFHQ